MSIRTLIAPSIVLVFAACALPSPPGDGSAEADTATTTPPDPDRPLPEEKEQDAECTQARAATEGLLRAKCGDCHDNGKTEGGLGQISDLDGLIAKGVVLRGLAEDSVLYRRVLRGDMPLGGEPLSDEELATLEGWINVCTAAEEAKADISLDEPPGCLDNPLTAPAAVLAAIRDDINDLDQSRARTTRYLTITHLHNAGYCETQIEGYRHALAKLLNHLSQNPDIRAPQTIDRARTIFRIDLDDYGWDEETWKAITDEDPYAIEFQGEDAGSIRKAAEVALFSVKGDWFLDAASQPPLYHTILKIPATRGELEASLGVNVEQNIVDELKRDDDEVLRAGFLVSKVSDFNRVIERHPLPSADYRAYWLSYDFASNEGVKSIFDRPLDFQQDGGEIIFHLPNGLQGYMLVGDADLADGVARTDQRIDRGPEEIVRDREVPQEPIVINGLSCMSCHSEGMRVATDLVAGVVAGRTTFDQATKEQVAGLYAPAEAFSSAQLKDVETFARAMAELDVPRRVGSYEPIMAAHLAFNEPIDLRRAAAEFGVPEDELLTRVGELRGLSKIRQITVDREIFQVNFAANACLLNLGLTKAPECGEEVVEQ